MQQARLWWLSFSLGGLLLGSACSNEDGERGYESCVDYCELANGCSGTTADCSSCDSSRESAEDAGCETEWADYMDCSAAALAEEGCEGAIQSPVTCASQLAAENDCYVEYCADNPSECEMAS